MYRLFFIFSLFYFFMMSGCTASTTFRVLDAETKEPIEGAVALAMWTRARGVPGLTSRYTAKAVEAVSDAKGILTFAYAWDTPRLKIYKPGYVGWDSLRIYLGCYEENKTLAKTKRREDFTMRDKDIFLEPWKDEYTYISHERFIQTYSNLSKYAGIKDSKYEKAIRYEVPFMLKEIDLKKK